MKRYRPTRPSARRSKSRDSGLGVRVGVKIVHAVGFGVGDFDKTAVRVLGSGLRFSGLGFSDFVFRA